MKKVLIGILVLLLFTMQIQAKTYTKKECKQYAYQEVIKKRWSKTDYNNLVKLWNKESGWRVKAKNGIYYGICQTNKKHYGKDYNNYKVQIKWGLKYIKKRYKTPTSAWKFWEKHHWY